MKKRNFSKEIRLLEKNGYVVMLKESFDACMSNARLGKAVIQNKNGKVIALQG